MVRPVMAAAAAEAEAAEALRVVRLQAVHPEEVEVAGILVLMDQVADVDL